MSSDEIQALEARLRELRQEEQREAEERRNAVKPTYQFLLTPIKERHTTFGGDQLFDDDCRLYHLEGTVTNKEELEAVGHRYHFEGGMRYVFNAATGKFACAVSGGSVFLSSKEGWKALSEYVDYNPDGGDVTEIVTKYRNAKEV